jgi:hypothetical protein
VPLALLLAAAALSREQGLPEASSSRKDGGLGQLIPEDLVKNGTLVVSKLNFSITAPQGWQWHQLRLPDIEGSPATSFSAIAPGGYPIYMLIVWQAGSGHQTLRSRGDLEKFIRNMSKTLPAGWTASDPQILSSDLPFAGTTKLRTSLHLPEDRTLYQHVYIVTGKFTYLLMTFSADQLAPIGFFGFARSFKFLDPSANETPPSPANGLIMLLAIAGAIFDWRYVRAGGIRTTRREWVYLAIAIGLCALLLVWRGSRGGSAEALGSLMATLLIWIFGVWELKRLLIRRKFPIGRPTLPGAQG